MLITEFYFDNWKQMFDHVLIKHGSAEIEQKYDEILISGRHS